MGPAVLWDDPKHRPLVETIQWRDLEPTEAYSTPVQITRRILVQSHPQNGFSRHFIFIDRNHPDAADIPLCNRWRFFWKMDFPFSSRTGERPWAAANFPASNSAQCARMRRESRRLWRRAIKRTGRSFILKTTRGSRASDVSSAKPISMKFPSSSTYWSGTCPSLAPGPSPRMRNQFCSAGREFRAFPSARESPADCGR